MIGNVAVLVIRLEDRDYLARLIGNGKSFLFGERLRCCILHRYISCTCSIKPSLINFHLVGNLFLHFGIVTCHTYFPDFSDTYRIGKPFLQSNYGNLIVDGWMFSCVSVT